MKKVSLARWSNSQMIDEYEGVVLNGWQLATLFSREQYNRMIDWDWDETAQLCLAAAPAV